MPAAPVTSPNVFEVIDVPTPEYCTVLNTLFAEMRASRLRVSPNEIVLESDPLTDTVPGSSIELRDAFPYIPAGKQYGKAGGFGS
jgi:hypothetical protein